MFLLFAWRTFPSSFPSLLWHWLELNAMFLLFAWRTFPSSFASLLWHWLELNALCNVAGVKRDMEEAMALYKRSAELGNESAKFRLQEVEARLAISQWSGRSAAKPAKAFSPTWSLLWPSWHFIRSLCGLVRCRKLVMSLQGHSNFSFSFFVIQDSCCFRNPMKTL